MPLILFPSQPFSIRDADPDFADEREVARSAGFDVALVDHTRVTRDDAEAAVQAVPEASDDAVYRGWMLTPEQYSKMFAALAARGVRLLNSPEAYRTCHYLPENVALLGPATARTVSYPVHGPVNFEDIASLLTPFGDSALVLKDYVKSQKHYLAEACFIPRASDTAAVERTVKRFLELQAEDLNGGLVFREFLPLRILATHPKSGMPLAAEFRTFWFAGEMLLSHRYWGELTQFDAELPLDDLSAIAARVPSVFFTMDIAFRADAGWTIIELGDAQVSGLPSSDLAAGFYQQLRRSWGTVAG